jgi:hypothetical protein
MTRCGLPTALANRRRVVKWLAYPLTDPGQFDILQSGPFRYYRSWPA